MKNGMKKLSVLLGIIAVLIGTVVVAVTILTRRAHSVSIIGGADGPTSIFLAGKVDPTSLVLGIVLGAVLLVVGVILVVKNRGKRCDDHSN